VAAVARGARLVRTHDVAATRQALDAAWPILSPAFPAGH
jgi:dihydropteroate synthase